MFEAAEVGRSLSREDFKKLEPQIHQLFLSLQQRLGQSNKALIIIVAGVEGAGKGDDRKGDGDYAGHLSTVAGGPREGNTARLTLSGYSGPSAPRLGPL